MKTLSNKEKHLVRKEVEGLEFYNIEEGEYDDSYQDYLSNRGFGIRHIKYAKEYSQKLCEKNIFVFPNVK